MGTPYKKIRFYRKKAGSALYAPPAIFGVTCKTCQELGMFDYYPTLQRTVTLSKPYDKTLPCRQLAARDFLAIIIIGKEALASLNAEPARTNHLAEQRVGAIFRIASLAVQGLHNRKIHIMSNQICRVQRAGLHEIGRAHV